MFSITYVHNTGFPQGKDSTEVQKNCMKKVIFIDSKPWNAEYYTECEFYWL